jgi:hypothetical protein
LRGRCFIASRRSPQRPSHRRGPEQGIEESMIRPLGQGVRICTSNRGDRAVCPAVSYPTVLHKVLHKPPPERPGTPINPLHPLIFHNNIHKAGSIRNRQVIGSSPIVGSILSIIYSHFLTVPGVRCDVDCDVDSADRWLLEPNPTPDAGSALRHAHPRGP